MSVFMTLRIKADPSRLQEVMASNDARWQAVNSRAKELGAIHHRFMAGADGTEILVLDEWESAEAFQKFFEASDDIRAMMTIWAERLGVQPGRIQFRDMYQKWGSCSSRGNITLNTALCHLAGEEARGLAQLF